MRQDLVVGELAGRADFQRATTAARRARRGHRHKSRPLLEVYRGGRCERQWNRRGGKTKV